MTLNDLLAHASNGHVEIESLRPNPASTLALATAWAETRMEAMRRGDCVAHWNVPATDRTARLGSARLGSARLGSTRRGTMLVNAEQSALLVAAATRRALTA